MSHLKTLMTFFLITIGWAVSAVADVTLQGTMDVNVSMLSMSMKARSIRQLSGSRFKETISVEDSSALLALFGKTGFSVSTIINAETGESITINPIDSSYQVQLLADAISKARKTMSGTGRDSAALHKPQVTLQIEKSDSTRIILGYECHKKTIRATIHDTAGLFPGDFRVEISVWLARDVPGAKEMASFRKTFKQKFDMNSGSELGVLMEAFGMDRQEIERAFPADEPGLELMMRIRAYMTPSVTQSQMPNAGDSGKSAQPSEVFVGELTSMTTEISEKAISPSEFTVPAGFKRVEPAPAVDSSH